MKKSLIFALAACAAMASCSHNDNWKVNGTLTNATDGATVAVERLGGMGWIAVDSVKVGKDGKFAYTAAPGMPVHDIFRLTYDGKSIYFPVDSIEEVTVSADAANFDKGYTLGGSPLADSMMAVETKIAEAVSNQGINYVLGDSLFRRELAQVVLDDPTGVLSYYLINKKIGDHSLFSETVPMDVQIIGAVANKFHTLYPDDPRTAALERKHRFAKVNLNPDRYQGSEIEATVSGLIDLDMIDEKGAHRKLSDVAADADVTILNFTSYLADWSVPYNLELNRLYDQFKDRNIAIYQVSFDESEVDWSVSARNLPWVTVLCAPNQSQTVVLHYNVNHVPLSYIINKDGDLVERVDFQAVTDDDKALEKAVRRAL